ncbi:hypothetical protein GE09DRAFT_94327 [Coniochaeta sp. 2T2.1]|nr:hypothetical protein GE09DRAFT_94327 [Coniochaeta sp. 2T2.1]
MASKDEAGSQPLERPCKKCNKQEATQISRTEAVCTDCFTQYIYSKCVRQIGIIGKETQPPQGAPQGLSRRYVLGLSLGTSSTVLLHIVNGYVSAILSKGRRSPFDLDVICVDTSISSDAGPNTLLEDTLATYRQRYPGLNIESIPLTSVLGIPSIDWSSLPPLNTSLSPSQQLHDLFSRLPSATSRADILRLFIRHLLIHTALARDAQAALFGHSTTALGALTLSETAKGRGFSLPWQINDGPLPVPTYPTSSSSPTKSIRIHHPLRELYAKELSTYVTLTSPPLTEIIPPPEVVDKATAAVVSHRDLSIDEVMARYFVDVEENYPSIVANVVRTTAKLDRIESGSGRCGVCGMTLDEDGDDRWRGDIGDDVEEREGGGGRLCYGCERSVHG